MTEVCDFDPATHTTTFRGATGYDIHFLKMPEKAHLFAVVPTARWATESGVRWHVGQEPPTLQTSCGECVPTAQSLIGNFPPVGESVIYADGRTSPVNLLQLILERIEAGWTVDEALAAWLEQTASQTSEQT